MLANFLKIAWRNLLRHPGYSFLNISGLALGIAAAFVLLFFVKEETSYEKHFDNHENIYRIASDFYNIGGFAQTSEAVFSWLKEECKEVKYATALNNVGNDMPITVDNVEYIEGRALAIDSNFFRMFSFDLLEGNPRHLMKDPDEVVITERLAKKYFGASYAIGETILVGKEKKPYRVTGIVKDSKKRTHLSSDLFLPLELENRTNWTSASIFVYVMLHEQSTSEQLAESLEGLRKDKIYPTFPNETSYESWATGSHRVEYFIQPLASIYLKSKFRFDLTAGGNPQQVAILGVIGIFLVLIAIVNYINLTTARSSVRAKEVGVKKTLGADSRILSRQFLMEALFTSFLAMVVALALAEFLLNLFEQITGQQMTETLFTDWTNVLYLLGLSLLTGLLAGSYPAFYLTKFRPIKVLKGQLALSGNKWLRGGLVVFQFSIAVALMIGSLIVFRQLQFMQNTDKGFEQEGVMIITNVQKLGTQAKAFQEEIQKYPQVVSTSFNDRMPGGNFLWMYTFQTPQMEESITMQTFPIDEDYLPTLGFRLTQGRNFSKDIASDSSGIILNEAAVEALGLAGKDPVGAEVNRGYRVVGVVENFNFQSLRNEIEPAAMSFGPTGHRMALKLKGNQMAQFLSNLENTWDQFSQDEAVSYTFLDENFAQLAAKESMLGKAVSIFTGLALIIACLGLFGLAAFMAERRTKEIGIRKVLGAGIANLVGLLSKDFLKLVLLSLVIASPITYYFMDNWLQDFAYRTDIQWWIFALVGLAAIVIALATVSFQSVRAAMANPVKSLRSE